MMHVGVTGTREGTTIQQRHLLAEWIKDLADRDVTLHHGDCIGVDEAAAGLAHVWGIRTEAHPPRNKRYRAFCNSDVVHDPLDYLDRDQVIVDSVSLLIAVPKGMERVRSGTWATVRMARKAGKPINIIWPNGVVTMETSG